MAAARSARIFYRLNVFPPRCLRYGSGGRHRRARDTSSVATRGKRARHFVGSANGHSTRLQSYLWPGTCANCKRHRAVGDRRRQRRFTVDESWLSAAPPVDSPLGLSGALAAYEKALIEDALRTCGGRVFGPSGAAARLGIPRSTLNSKFGPEINKIAFRVQAQSVPNVPSFRIHPRGQIRPWRHAENDNHIRAERRVSRRGVAPPSGRLRPVRFVPHSRIGEFHSRPPFDILLDVLHVRPSDRFRPWIASKSARVLSIARRTRIHLPYGSLVNDARDEFRLCHSGQDAFYLTSIASLLPVELIVEISAVVAPVS